MRKLSFAIAAALTLSVAGSAIAADYLPPPPPPPPPPAPSCHDIYGIFSIFHCWHHHNWWGGGAHGMYGAPGGY